MRRHTRKILTIALALQMCFLSQSSAVWAQEKNSKGIADQHAAAAQVESYLEQGNLSQGETILLEVLRREPHNDQVRFGLGMLQFLRAVERLVQDLHRFGLRDSLRGEHIPVLRLPVPVNAQPELLTYKGGRQIVQTFASNLMQAEKTLAGITDADVKLPLHFGLIRMDFNGDGQATESETLWRLYESLRSGQSIKAEAAHNFAISFDQGDIHWLRGYCHLLVACCEMFLAYDTKEMFDCTAHLFFKNVDSPYRFLRSGKHVFDSHDGADFVDFIALLHLIRWQLSEPSRMTSALRHLQESVAQSRESWRWILAETDDDNEWIPNPKQKGVIPNVKVTAEMVASWQDLLSEADRMLAGEVLIPFWRGETGQGVNLRKVFLEPRTFDLVLWVQGTAASPYLETGRTTNSDTWRRLNRVFNGQFVGFAIWFN